LAGCAPAESRLAKKSLAHTTLERRIEDEEACVGVVDDRGELLALPLEDADLPVEQASPRS
jgi:hypothetical protein